MSEPRRCIDQIDATSRRSRLRRAALAATFLLVPFQMASSETTQSKAAGSQEPSPSAALPVPWLVSRMGSLDEFDAMSPLPANADSARFALGDAHGFVHVYERRGSAFQEIWLSEFLEGAVGGILVRDVDADDLAEIIVYTEAGRLYILDAADYRTLWSNPPNEYERLSALAISNIDDDDQQELILCADGRLVVYDGRDRFEEWRSDQTELQTAEIIVDDVDGDGADEIVLNDGFVFDARFLDLEWQSPVAFGRRIATLDIDSDGIPEIIGEVTGNILRIFDVDLRLEKSARQ